MHDLLMTIPAQSETVYPIKIGEQVLLNPKAWLPDDCLVKKMVIITDDHINTLYGPILVTALAEFKPLLFTFLSGEISKTNKTKQTLEEQMLQQHCDRDTLILALGGGVVGDLAGFIAATYMRGIPYIQIPTSLLAMVDSSVGGKTGINTSQGKNVIGAFWQPRAVIMDTTCLMTLSEIQMINGLIEALKMFMTHSLADFNYVDTHLDRILNKDMAALNHVVQQAVTIKISMVSLDEQDHGQRMTLNFGHTIGHA